jgi:hypothetical protein
MAAKFTLLKLSKGGIKERSEQLCSGVPVEDERTMCLRQEGVDDLDVVRYVDDDILESEHLEGGLLSEADLVASNAHFGVLCEMSRFCVSRRFHILKQSLLEFV